jgi:diguanylate cyclase (GGDEF)-like protein/PAS domain S-box-containing protein
VSGATWAAQIRGAGQRALRRLRRSLLARLLAMFALGGLLVATLLVFGSRMQHDAEQRLENAVIRQIRPLASIHRLQTRSNDLRLLELEYPHTEDFFAVVQHLGTMETEIEALAQELAPYLAFLAIERPEDARRLEEHWAHYRRDLEEMIRLARSDEPEAAGEASHVHSHNAHRAISTLLRDLVIGTELAAEEAYLQAQTEQKRQDRFFLSFTLGGLLLLASALLLFARSLAKRIRTLRDAASDLAAGEGHQPIDICGDDEIADLSIAFNAMQDKVVARERQLRTAQEELENRVSARTQALAAANARLWLLSQAVEQSPIGVLIATIDRRVEYVNPAYVKVTGRPAETMISREMAATGEASPAGEAEAEKVLRVAYAAGQPWEGERRNRRPDGTDYWEHLRLATVLDQRGQPAHLLLMREDISERKQHEEKVAFQAYYDSLTGLPNRSLALDRLQLATLHAQREHAKCVVMFIDLDNFKQINDTLGHRAGDQLLCQAAERLRAVVRAKDTVARLGGDEFLVVLGGVVHVKDAEIAAANIVRAFVPLFSIEGREFSASPSIGLSLFPDDGAEPAVLLRNADLAMYEAKEAGRNTYRFFNQKIHDDSVERLELERQLRGALERGELSLHYQPLVAAHDGSLIGAEALLRWHHPELGNIPPDRFIPVAEQSGLIVGIGAWVLDEACAQAARWRAARGGEFLIAVNVSPRQFACPDLVGTVRACVERYAIPPQQLEIEVTEGLLIRNPNEVREAMDQLAALGVAVSLDDFGTGYSSLSYLRAFPFHTVKIDRSFVRDLSEDAEDRALVVAAIRMACALGLRVIAEGVETEAQREFLAAQEADVLQGYLFGRPQTAETFERDWISATRPTTRRVGST